jgi:hypothetical protein
MECTSRRVKGIDMNAKDLLQKAWVFEVIWLLLNFTVCLYVFPEKVGPFMGALPLLTTLIGGQGILAAAGPEIKRLIESKNGGG